MEIKTLHYVQDFYMISLPSPIWVKPEIAQKLYAALADLEWLAYDKDTPAALKENLEAMLDLAYPKVLSKE